MATNDKGYGGLDNLSMSPPSEEVTTFPLPSDIATNGNIVKSLRWSAPKEGEVQGNYFEIKRLKNGDRIALRPVGPKSAFIYSHAPGSYDRSGPKIKLWVREIIFGWSMEYRESQTIFGKSFYPRHIHYSDVVVRAQTASQAHYDQMVSSVLDFHVKALVGTPDVVRFELPRLAYKSLDLPNGAIGSAAAAYSAMGVSGLYDIAHDGDQEYRVLYDTIQFDGYLTNVKAGHTKSVFYPEIELNFAVMAYDKDLIASTNSNQSADIVSAYKSSLDPKTNNNVNTADPLAESGATYLGGYGPGGTQGPR